MTCDLCEQSKKGLVVIQDQDGRIIVCADCVRAMPPFLRPDVERAEIPELEPINLSGS